MLWTGLPVLTCRGASFASRVAASLLQAAGLPELNTGSLAECEALALRVAATRRCCAPCAIGSRAIDRTCALFDIDRFRRHIESAYTMTWDIQ